MPEPAASRPSTSPATDAKVAILKAADAIRRRASSLLASRGITFQQYNVLRILRGAKAGPLANAEIAGRTIETVPDVGALLGDLETKGLIRAEGAPAAGSRWTVTASALDLLGQMDGPVAAADRAAIEGLTEEEVRSLVGILERVRAQA
jgi:MarR family 2-MHQ and catechol resistance regulon transcriptional repressor